jgi:hypothetical protein
MKSGAVEFLVTPVGRYLARCLLTRDPLSTEWFRFVEDVVSQEKVVR